MKINNQAQKSLKYQIGITNLGNNSNNLVDLTNSETESILGGLTAAQRKELELANPALAAAYDTLSADEQEEVLGLYETPDGRLNTSDLAGVAGDILGTGG